MTHSAPPRRAFTAENRLKSCSIYSVNSYHGAILCTPRLRAPGHPYGIRACFCRDTYAPSTPAPSAPPYDIRRIFSVYMGLTFVLPPRVIFKLEVVVIIEVKGALIAGDVHVGVGSPTYC